jgi:hypothetical protein
MKISTKAALLSGLVFPGLGHMVLKQYLRGSISALIGLSVIVTKAVNQALAIVDKINSGEIPLEAGAITDQVSNSTGGAEGLILNIATFVVVACWLIGIIDSYRVGINQEKQRTPDLIV